MFQLRYTFIEDLLITILNLLREYNTLLERYTVLKKSIYKNPINFIFFIKKIL